VGLAVAVSRIRARLREEAGESDRGITVSQVAMLQRLVERGAMSASDLAASEHVTQQAIAQRLDLLKPTGYVELTPDPQDRRRKLVTITDAGRALLDTLAVASEEWLARAIAATVEKDELETLAKAVDLLDRLAAADTRPENLLR
jgi:DNA-binding MarR family transcriptional regulator